MSKEHQEEHFTEFQGHTLLKHGVLDRYVKAWIQILKGLHEKLWIVDGFAGRGKDDAGNPGSPLLLARSAAQLREEGADVRLFAVEVRRDNYDALTKNLAEFDIDRGGPFPIAYLRHGLLVDHMGEAFRLIGEAPAFVFLDPFGAGGLSLNIVERTLALPKGEVFALFSYRAIHRHLSVLATDYTARARREAADQPGLFPDLDDEVLAEQLEHARKSDATLLPTKGAAQRILVELFGSLDDIRRILTLPVSAWANEVLRAYLGALERCGATHITRMAVFDDEQKGVYYLLHAAKNPKAALKMKESAHSAINKSRLPTSTKDCIRLSHAVRITEVVAAVRGRFEGQEVHWTDDQRSTESVQGYALSETPMFYDQAKELREALEPFAIKKKPLLFQFPPSH